MTIQCKISHIAAGGNRNSSASDWADGLLAFGAGNNIALWNPDASDRKGISALLAGHADTVNAIRIYDQETERLLVSGGADKTIRIWRPSTENPNGFAQSQCLSEHTNSINAITVLPRLGIFASGAADGTVKIWQLQNAQAKLVQSISLLKPRFLPLALAVTVLSTGDVVVAVAGTCNIIQLFVRPAGADLFELQASLSGHDGWIRSLDFTQETQAADSDILLASASQDKYIRLWRFHKSQHAVTAESDDTTDFAAVGERRSLSNKAHRVGGEHSGFNVTFEALLIGHEDWIYTARWRAGHDTDSKPTLLSASADNSLSIWHADSASGLWVCSSRLGEVSAQKGSTTATGSAGGFWVGLWHPQGRSVVSLGRTGSWRRWKYDSSSDTWVQDIAISGHVQEVLGVTWSPRGDYLLTASSDQTTRLLAEWARPGVTSWHELSRPQIHGYDLNCIDTITNTKFISGADEKLLRVFDMPRAVNTLMSKLGCTTSTSEDSLPEAANVPVLGLSNKALTAENNESVNGAPDGSNNHDEVDPTPLTDKHTLDVEQPPFEDVLARHSLWPEHEKLYGHGYEISAVATSNDGSLVATACKATSVDHAVIRLYETREWREVKPALKAHSLTVTCLAFSPDDQFLVSAGRDRQWVIFKRSSADLNTYAVHEANPKGHSRMILGCAWAPLEAGHAFATGGRDKTVKIWKLSDKSASCVITISAGTSVTSLDWKAQSCSGNMMLAYGTDDGKIGIASLDGHSLEVKGQGQLDIAITPNQAINSLKWRPSLLTSPGTMLEADQLAIGGDDHSVRIYEIS